MRSAMPISEAGSRPASPAGHEIPPPPNSSAGVPGSPQIRERKPPAVQATLKTLLPVHMKLFEKHRLVEMKKLLRNMIMNDVQYHAKALEAYSQLMECIHEADERDSNQPL